MQPMNIGGVAASSTSEPGGASPFSAASHAYARLHGLYSEAPTSRKALLKRIAGSLAIILLLVIPAVLIARSASSSSDDGVDDDTDPLVFEIEIEDTVLRSKEETLDPESKDDDEILSNLPADCKSRRADNPGVKDGARIQYIHIPQTGGKSVEHAMLLWNKGTVFRYNRALVDGSNTACPPETLKQTLLAGQRGFGFCEEVSRDPKLFFSFTVLRDPVERLISLFDAQIRPNKEPFYTKTFGTRTLNELIIQFNKTSKLESGEALLRFIATQQVRYMCGYECFMAKNKTLNEPKAMLERALANLHRLDAVTTTGAINDVIDQLKVHLRWLPVGFKTFPKLNSAVLVPSRLDIPARRIVANWAKEDTILYKEAEKLAAQKTRDARKCLRGSTEDPKSG